MATLLMKPLSSRAITFHLCASVSLFLCENFVPSRPSSTVIHVMTRAFTRSRIRLARSACVLVLSSVLASACGSQAERGARLSAIPGLQPAELIHTTNYSGFAHPVRLLIRHRADWENVWAQINAKVEPQSEAPAVDFTRDMLLLVSPGWGSPGGPNLHIEGYTYRGDTMYLHVRIMVHCVVGAAVIQLAVVSRVPRHDGVVRVIDRVEPRHQRCR
jgi:hypothetical protein